MEFIKSVLFLLAFSATLQECYSFIMFEATGNVYPLGYYHVTINIGIPPKPYSLQIDTGNSLTWIQCEPCVRCPLAPHPAYKPLTSQLVSCTDPLCGAVHQSRTHYCDTLDDRCNYEVNYLSGGSSFGFLFIESFPLKYDNGTITKPIVTFGCGYHQELQGTKHRPVDIDGTLGLGLGKEGILSQLQEVGVTRNLVGHCFSSQEDGYIFFGDGLVPEGTVWTPILPNNKRKHYYLGVAELVFGATHVMDGLDVVFDSGTTYTYLIPKAYNDLVYTMKNEIQGVHIDSATDKDFSVCWKGSKPFESIADVKDLFIKPITLDFGAPTGTWFEIQAEGYLIINKHGSVCLGVKSSAEIGEDSLNIIGAISFLDQIIMYDNQSQKIGWAPANCKFIE